jgi:hypothetical protein
VSLLDRIRLRGHSARSANAGVPDGMVPADKLASQARRDAVAAQAAVPERDRELLAQRERLTERFTMMQTDLGGVFYEMAIRDHVRMDVLTQKAAELQRIDADLAQVERELRGEIGVAAGSCPACGTPHSVEARFCSNCGQVLAAPDAVVVDGADQITQQIARTNGTSGTGA